MLTHSQAEIRDKLEQDIPKLMGYLMDSNSEVRQAALNATRSLVQHCE
jgi:hypothetical protein